MKLYEITSSLREVASIDAPYEQLADTLDDLRIDFAVKVDGCLAIRQEYVRQSEVYQSEIDRLAELKRANDSKAESLKKYVLDNMVSSGIKKHTGLFSATIAKGLQYLSIKDENLIPSAYLVVKQSVDKRKITQDIKGGIEVYGAELVTGSERILIK